MKRYISYIFRGDR